MELKAVFRKQLKRVMNEQCMSQLELSMVTGIPKSGISQYLSGKYLPKDSIIEKIASALNCSVDELTSDKPFNLFEAKNVTVEQAAKMLGKSKQFVRLGLQRKELPFGAAVIMSGYKYSYYISPKRFYEFIGEFPDDKTEPEN